MPTSWRFADPQKPGNSPDRHAASSTHPGDDLHNQPMFTQTLEINLRGNPQHRHISVKNRYRMQGSGRRLWHLAVMLKDERGGGEVTAFDIPDDIFSLYLWGQNEVGFVRLLKSP